MNIERNADSMDETAPGESLTKVLGQSEHVKDLVEACAEELSTVNVGLKREIRNGEGVPGLERALEKTEAVEDKVQEASEVLAGVNRALESEVNERHQLEDRLAAVTELNETACHAALHDALTGLPNRTLFRDRLEHGLAQAARHGRSLAVMFLDLNGFKSINDTYGHAAGDCVLRSIAGRLESNTRSDDTVSRHGGDEFLYLLMEIPGPDAVAPIAEKILDVIRLPCEVTIDDKTFVLSVNASLGISMFPNHGTTADALIDSADKAMYVAKQGGLGFSFAG